MGKRVPKNLPDHHLWTEVKKTVRPLRPEPVEEAAPIAPPKPRKLTSTAVVAPAAATPLVLPPQMPAGRIIEPKLRRKVSRGRIEIDGTIDLHGMRQEEARTALHRFITARAARGDRTLLVITGKGLKKLDDFGARLIERGVLRHMLPRWLSEPSLSPLIAGWDVSAQQHGGEGAFYVLLRRVEDPKQSGNGSRLRRTES
jgi:DNA-nicking Smr family endonuclease